MLKRASFGGFPSLAGTFFFLSLFRIFVLSAKSTKIRLCNAYVRHPIEVSPGTPPPRPSYASGGIVCRSSMNDVAKQPNLSQSAMTD